MVFGRFFGKKQEASFKCVYDECESLCCKKNLVVLTEDDINRLKKIEIDFHSATESMDLNSFLKSLGWQSIKQLEGLEVLHLKKDDTGNCHFLDRDKGVCKIYSQRPYYCRVFPFKFSKNNIKTIDPICPGTNRGESLEVSELKEILGIGSQEKKPPLLRGDEKKLKTSRALMKMVFKMMR